MYICVCASTHIYARLRSRTHTYTVLHRTGLMRRLGKQPKRRRKNDVIPDGFEDLDMDFADYPTLGPAGGKTGRDKKSGSKKGKKGAKRGGGGGIQQTSAGSESAAGTIHVVFVRAEYCRA